MLEEVGDDAEADAGAAAGDDVGATAEVRDVGVGVEFVAGEEGDHFGGVWGGGGCLGLWGGCSLGGVFGG